MAGVQKRRAETLGDKKAGAVREGPLDILGIVQYPIARMARHESALPEAELLQGTLDLLILKVLALEPLHGYGVVQRLKQITHDALQIRQGSLYPALYRLEKRGYLKSTWKTVAGRDAKFYALTKSGEAQLEDERAGWERLCAAVRMVLETAK